MSTLALLLLACIAGAAAGALWVFVDTVLRIRDSRQRFYEQYAKRKGPR